MGFTPCCALPFRKRGPGYRAPCLFSWRGEWVDAPSILAGCIRSIHAAIFRFRAGVMPRFSALSVWLTAPKVVRQTARIRAVLEHLTTAFRTLPA